jgi:hypothetical protein
MPTHNRVDTVGERANTPHRQHDPWIEKTAWLMDSAIPIGRWSVGLDGLLSFVPGLGDLAGTVISMLIVLRAVAAGVPRVAVARMMANIAIDSLLGTVPIVGDLFDLAYKSNMKNLRIYQESLRGAPRAMARHWGFFIVVSLALMAVMALPIIGILLILQAR